MNDSVSLGVRPLLRRASGVHQLLPEFWKLIFFHVVPDSFLPGTVHWVGQLEPALAPQGSMSIKELLSTLESCHVRRNLEKVSKLVAKQKQDTKFGDTLLAPAGFVGILARLRAKKLFLNPFQRRSQTA